MTKSTKHDVEILEFKAQLWGSFLLFCKTFYPLVTGRPFVISSPVGRESHFITVSRELTLAKKMQVVSLLINIPPGSGKSTLIAMWVAWTLSEFPDSQYLYISYGFELAAKHCEFIRRIISCPMYAKLFNVHIRHDMKAKDHFMTTAGGSIKAFGATGPVVGFDAGLAHQNRFSGAVLIDDAHKIDESHSDSIRQGVIQNYRETILQRPRSPNVPIIYIGQRVHEDDLCAYMLSGNDERVWKPVILQALDGAGNALYPEVNPLPQLLEKKLKNPYVFSSQYQQEPVPSGGALFKERDFEILDEEPEFVCTFLTVDTAETSKTYNDASVFSFWGLYKIADYGQEQEEYALHWIDCWEMRVEPKELESNFKSFWSECMLHKTKPRIAAIEKKSTGVTLCSILSDMRGLEVREVKRTKASGSKTARYLEMQPIIASKLVSFTRGAKHLDMCVKHMLKITANDSHRHDDICDTIYDAVKIALIDKTLWMRDAKTQTQRTASRLNAQEFNQRLAAIKAARGY
jgi:predicted phage terminase large subunit-like protein